MNKILALLFILGVAGCGSDGGHTVEAAGCSEALVNFRSSPETSMMLVSESTAQWIVSFHRDETSPTYEEMLGYDFDYDVIDPHSILLNIPAEIDKEELLAEFSANSYIVNVELDDRLSLPTVHGRVAASNQWHHATLGSVRAWNITKGSPEVVVAVIDSGVDFNHPDLAGQRWYNPKETRNGRDDDGNGLIDDISGWNYVERNNNPGPTSTTTGAYHGTHVAGIIAGGSNAKGYSGVSPNVKIMALKFLDKDKLGLTSNAIKAIHYAIDNGADVINLSFGSFKKNSQLLAALQKAERKGILVIAAAGNMGTNNDTKPFYPASYKLSNVLSVTASSKTDKAVSGINYGVASVDIAAPGLGILAPDKNKSYKSRSGSSMAAPFVAGAAALLLSVKPDLSVPQLKKFLLEGAVVRKQLKNRVRMGRRLSSIGSLSLLVSNLEQSKPASKIAALPSPSLIPMPTSDSTTEEVGTDQSAGLEEPVCGASGI